MELALTRRIEMKRIVYDLGTRVVPVDMKWV